MATATVSVKDLNPQSEEPLENRVAKIARGGYQSTSLNKSLDICSSLLSKAAGDEPAGSRQGDQGTLIGRRDAPFDIHKAKELFLVNSHHATCLSVKRDATVGMGFADEEYKAQRETIVTDPKPGESSAFSQVNPVETKTDQALDPLCDESFQAVLSDVALDFYGVGQGFLEVVREDPLDMTSPIRGLWHIPAECVSVHLDGHRKYHWLVQVDGDERHWPSFGRIRSFSEAGYGDQGEFSEVVAFQQNKCFDPYFAVPEWIAAVSDVELASSLKQYKLDFFYNRGVPEFLLLYKGEILSDTQWQDVVEKLQGHVGPGNAHKTMAFNTGKSDVEIEVVRLAMDNFNGEEEFIKTNEALNLSLVTAHRVPPVFAGILIPGKLGAVNEIPNSLMAFQSLYIGQHQRRFQRILGQTLGNVELNGNLDLTKDDFEFRRITDVIDPATMDTVSRMRQSLPEAQAEGRDLSEGLRD